MDNQSNKPNNLANNTQQLINEAQVVERLSSRTRALYILVAVLASVAIVLPFLNHTRAQGSPAQSNTKKLRNFDAQIAANANKLLEDGRQTFRFDTFGDQAFWAARFSFIRQSKVQLWVE